MRSLPFSPLFKKLISRKAVKRCVIYGPKSNIHNPSHGNGNRFDLFSQRNINLAGYKKKKKIKFKYLLSFRLIPSEFEKKCEMKNLLPGRMKIVFFSFDFSFFRSCHDFLLVDSLDFLFRPLVSRRVSFNSRLNFNRLG